MISLLAAVYATMFHPPPGAYDATATPAQVCRWGYAHAHRNVAYDIRDAVYDRYGLPRGHRAGKYVIDHLIPLEIGGSNDPRNLWPQPRGEAARKDLDENRLHDAVCSGHLTLAGARTQMLHLWGP